MSIAEDRSTRSVGFSVVVAAHDAVATLPDTLDSLLAQTFAGWEAIVVDDGSTDATGEIAAAYATRDARIRVVRQAQAGEGGARNTSVAAARESWLLFLDADDWIAPEALARFADAIAAHPDLDAIHCGWVHVDPDGRVFGTHRCPLTGDLFDALAVSAQFPVHACIVRRELVERVGAFDRSLRSCADWDLWQRVARTGARFGSVPDALAWYRVRPRNTWTGGGQFLRDGLRLVTQGHEADARVRAPSAAHAAGRARDELAAARFTFACSPAAMEIARGGDARSYLDVVPDEPAPDLDPAAVAHTIFYSAPRTLCREVEHWPELWPQVEEHLRRFLAALEERAHASGLARRAAREIERLVLAHAGDVRPLTIGATHAVRIEIAAPISDVTPPAGVERVECALTLEGEALDAIQLPVCDGMVSSDVLTDAIAAEHAWRIVGRFFERTVYRELESRASDGRASLVRGATPVGDDLPSDPRPVAERAHAGAGWTVFLQELWGRPQWPRERFFAKDAQKEPPNDALNDKPKGAPKDQQQSPAPQVRARDGIVCELSAELPDVSGAGEQLDVVPTVGGAALGIVRVPTHEGRVGADRLRAAIIAAAGMELCRVAVREALVGRPLEAAPKRLRERLALAAGATHNRNGAGGSGARAGLAGWDKSLAAEVLHGARGGIAAHLTTSTPGLVLARRYADAIGASASRRATLPGAAATVLAECAEAAGELVLRDRRRDASSRVVYAPDVVFRPAASIWRSLASRARSLLARGPAFAQQRRAAGGAGGAVRVPILMYHRIASGGAPATSRYRVAPDAFARQLAVLRDAGYRSLDPEEWREAVRSRRPLAGRPVMLTFDDGHADFATEAWPLLERFGFSAIVFVVADRIGSTAVWEAMRGEEPPLLGWEEITRLAAKGVVFGSHSASHARLTGLDPVAATDEMARSRAILSRGLGRAVDAIAYPHGAQDPVVRHLAGACGYTFGFSCEPGLAGFDDSLLALPRLEVRADMDVSEFRRALGADAAPSAELAAP